jgi:hypothetical protein
MKLKESKLRRVDDSTMAHLPANVRVFCGFSPFFIIDFAFSTPLIMGYPLTLIV